MGQRKLRLAPSRAGRACFRDGIAEPCPCVFLFFPVLPAPLFFASCIFLFFGFSPRSVFPRRVNAFAGLGADGLLYFPVFPEKNFRSSDACRRRRGPRREKIAPQQRVTADWVCFARF